MKKTTKTILFLLSTIGVFLSNLVMSISPIGQPLLTSFGDGTGMLDFKFYYSANEAYQSLLSLGDKGQAVYTRLLLIDFIFILCTAYFFSRILLFTIDKLKISKSYKKLAWTAYARSIFDGVENVLLLLTILMLPNGKVFLFFASIATVLKWVSMVLFILSFVVIFIIAIKNKVKK